MFTDEALFTHDAVNNTHNTFLVSRESWYDLSNFQNKFSIILWCSIIFNEILRPYIFQGPLTGWMFLNFMQTELLLLLEDIILVGWLYMYHQHDGAPPHLSRWVTGFLHGAYPGCWLGKGGPGACPPPSPDLNFLIFYLWGHTKFLVCEKLNSDALLHRVLDAAERIKNASDLLDRTISSLPQWAMQYIAVDGAQFEYLFQI